MFDGIRADVGFAGPLVLTIARAFVGDGHSGYRAHCADNTGMRWLGDRRPGVQWASKWSLAVYSDKNPNLLTSFNGRVAVAVQLARD